MGGIWRHQQNHLKQKTQRPKPPLSPPASAPQPPPNRFFIGTLTQMGSFSGIRPPQFSEDDAWLPPWLQQSNVEKQNVEDIKKDEEPTFVERVEGWQFLHMSISSRESCKERGGCNIGRLFLSGTDSSPFSFAQSPENVVQLHLRLSSDENSESTTFMTDAYPTETDFPIQPLEGSQDLGQSAKLSLPNKNELLRHEDIVKPTEAASEDVELCIAASEALVINEVIKSDSLLESYSASAILEASLQVKQARLEGWASTFNSSSDEISEIDNLSDLDDINMESAYEDAGIHVNELPGIELSVSRVKDTLESEHDEDTIYEKKDVSATRFGNSSDDSSRKELRVADSEIQLEKDLRVECSDDNTHMEITDDLAFALHIDGFGRQNNCLRSNSGLDEFGRLSGEKCKMPVADKISHETNISCSPIRSFPHPEQDENMPNVVQERFQSRWFGGWTPKPKENEVKSINIARQSILRPFAAETSFLSESADVAPDENSFVQNHDKLELTDSQLSKASENISKPAKDGKVISQDDVNCSNTSLVDPLCSVVPCSIEHTCSSPLANYDNRVPHRDFNFTNENKGDYFPTNNELSPTERLDLPISNIERSQLEVRRQFMSLSYYSKQLPDHANFLGKYSPQNKSFFSGVDAELSSGETPFTNNEKPLKSGAHSPVFNQEDISPVPLVVNRRTYQHFRASCSARHVLADNNSSRTEIPKGNVKCPPHEILQVALLNCKNQRAQDRPASKQVHFSEQKTVIPNNNEVPKMNIAASKVCSAKAAKKSALSISNLKSRAPPLDRFIKPDLFKQRRRLIFQNMEFILTGLSHQKEKEVEGLIRKYGGVVVSQLPLKILKGKKSCRLKSQVLPLVLCLKKIQSLKFLYGCAVNALVLKVDWLVDSIAAGFILPPKKYMILSRNINRKHAEVFTAVSYDDRYLVFNNVGIMLHGKNKGFSNIATIIKHGGGQVFKTLQRLVQTLEAGSIKTGMLVADNGSCVSRHLRQCALERNIPLMSINWIIKSLYAGRLVPLEENHSSQPRRGARPPRVQDPMELSQEI